jgi:hypothetical protein
VRKRSPRVRHASIAERSGAVQRFLPGVSVTEFRLRRAQGVLASLACRKRLLQLTDTLEKALLLMRLWRRPRYGGRYVPKFPQFFDWVMTAPQG